MSFQLPDAIYAQSLLNRPQTDPTAVRSTIKTLSLLPLPEGGFFIERDRDPLLVPNPFDTASGTSSTGTGTPSTSTNASSIKGTDSDPNTKVYNYSIASKSSSHPRNASTTIHYFTTPSSPVGRFHSNKARTVHTLHWGRARYIVLHPPTNSTGNKDAEQPGVPVGNKGWTMETFIVGHDIAAGEKVQWIVEGARFKASFLLPDMESEESGKGILISETVVPGFEYTDHEFLSGEKLGEIAGEEGVNGLGWLLRKEE
jgi:uncharacterized protein